MKTIIFFSIVLLVISFTIGVLIGRAPMAKYDLPEEFNTETISRDRLNPTEMMVIYNPNTGKYIFEFMDK